MRAMMVLALAASLPQHVLVYREPGRLGGWPANYGVWSWGNEIVVGFAAAYHKVMPGDRHQQDHDKPEEPRLARSLDGGLTWSIETNPGAGEPRDLTDAIDFERPGFAMTLRFASNHTGPSLLWYSYDRGHTWTGPFRFPQFGKGTAARTDYIVTGQRSALVFVTQAKANGREGRPICVRTDDGGLTWKLAGYIGDEPRGFAI